MGQIGVTVRYESPTIVQRERIAAVLTVSRSERRTPRRATCTSRRTSRPWCGATDRGRAPGPAISHREPLAGLLNDSVKSESRDGAAGSDRNIKDNVVPVAWSDGSRPYADPAITGREPLAGLLDAAPGSRRLQP